MIRIKNLTNTPYELTKVDGKKTVVPAMGETVGKFDSEYLKLMLMFGTFEVVEESPKDDEVKGVDPNIEDLKKEYRGLTGKKPDGRWNTERLLHEIEKLRSTDSAPEDTDNTEV